MYSFGGFPVFSEYILIKTSNIWTLYPVSARYLGVSGKNNSQIPVDKAGREHMKTKKFHEWKEKPAVTMFTFNGIIIHPTPEILNS